MLSNTNKSASPHIQFTLLPELLGVQHTLSPLAIPYLSQSQPLLLFRRAETHQNVVGARDRQLGMGWTVSMDQELILAVGQSHTEEP